MNSTRPLEFAAFIGIDWADKKHDVCLQSAGSEKIEHQILKHTPEAIDEWACGPTRSCQYISPVLA